MLTQVVYTSRPKFDPAQPPGRRTLDEIVEAARRHNTGAGVTGFLVVAPDRLAQILEGDSAIVGRTLNRILADPRHDNVQLLDMRLVPERRFGNWSMGVSDKLVLGPSPAGAGTLQALTATDFLNIAAAAAGPPAP